MAVVGTAWVRVKLITDKLESDLSKAVERSLSRLPDLSSLGQRMGRDLGEGISDGLDQHTMGITDTISNAIEDGIADADKHIEFDFDGIHERVNRDLDEIDDNIKINADVNFNEGSGADLGQKLAREIEIGWEERKKLVEHKITETIEDGIDNADKDIDIDVDANTLGFAAKMKYATRPRVVEVFVKLNKRSLVFLNEAIRRLSGLRTLTDWGDKLFRAFANLDKTAPLLAGIVVGLNAVVGAGGGLLSWLSIALKQIGSLAALALPLPALFIGGGAAIGVMVAVMGDFKTVLKGLDKPFTKLQDKLSAKFWARAEDPIRNMVSNLMPMFNTQLTDMADKLGSFVGEFVAVLGAERNVKRLATVFANTTKGIKAATGGLNGMVSGLFRLAAIGSKFLPDMGKWFAEAGDNFDAWVDKNERNGNIFRWVDEAKTNFVTLKNLMGDTVGVIIGLAKAGEAAGGGGINVLANAMDWLNDRINSVAGQTALTSFFSATRRGTDKMGEGFSDLAAAIGDSMGTIEYAMSTAGGIVSTFLSYIAELFDNDNFKAGVVDLISGVQAALGDLGPAIEPLGNILGDILTIAGDFLRELGPTLADGIIALEPIFDRLREALGPVIEDLGGALRGAIETLTPFVSDLADAFAWLVDSVGGLPVAIGGLSVFFVSILSGLGKLLGLGGFGGLMSVVGKVAKFVGPKLGGAFGFVMTKLGPIGIAIAVVVGALTWFFTETETGRQIVATAWEYIQKAISAVVDWWKGTAVPALTTGWEAIKDAAQTFSEWFSTTFGPLFDAVADAAGALFGFLGRAWDQLKAIAEPVLTWLSGQFSEIWTFMKSVWDVIGEPIFTAIKVVLDNLLAAFNYVWGTIVNIVQIAVGVLTGIFQIFAGVLNNDWSQVWEGVKTIVGAIWDGIVLQFQNFMLLLQTVWGNVWGAIGGTLTGVWDAIVSYLSRVTTSIINMTMVGWNIISTTISSIASRIVNFILAAWNAAYNYVASIGQRIQSAATSMWNSLVSFIAGIPGRILAALGALAALVARSTAWFSGFVNAARTQMENAVSMVRGIPGRIVGALGNLGSLLVNSGASLMRGLAQGIQNGIGAAVDAAKRAAAAVRDFFPFSPAKKGAFSGKGYTDVSGKKLMQDFGVGIKSGIKYATSAANTAAISVSTALVKTIRAGQEKIFWILRRDFGPAVLQGTAKQAVSMIDKLVDTLNKVKTPKTSALALFVQAQRETLTRLANQRTDLTAKIKAANKALEEQIVARGKFVTKIYEQSFDTSGILKSKTADSMIELLQKQVDATIKFRSDMEKLSKLGLSKGLLTQFAEAGAANGGVAASALLAGGAAAIKKVNVLEGTLARQSSSLANTLGDNLYNAGINATQGLVDGLLKQEKAVISAANTLANAIATTIRKTLGIKSPSRVTTLIGKQTGQGVPIGLLSQVADTIKASKALSAAMIPKTQDLAKITGVDRPRSASSATAALAANMSSVVAGDTLQIDQLVLQIDPRSVSDIDLILTTFKDLKRHLQQGTTSRVY